MWGSKRITSTLLGFFAGAFLGGIVTFILYVNLMHLNNPINFFFSPALAMTCGIIGGLIGSGIIRKPIFVTLLALGGVFSASYLAIDAHWRNTRADQYILSTYGFSLEAWAESPDTQRNFKGDRYTVGKLNRIYEASKRERLQVWFFLAAAVLGFCGAALVLFGDKISAAILLLIAIVVPMVNLPDNPFYKFQFLLPVAGLLALFVRPKRVQHSQWGPDDADLAKFADALRATGTSGGDARESEIPTTPKGTSLQTPKPDLVKIAPDVSNSARSGFGKMWVLPLIAGIVAIAYLTTAFILMSKTTGLKLKPPPW